MIKRTIMGSSFDNSKEVDYDEENESPEDSDDEECEES